MLIHRRTFLTGLLAAPIIVRPGILMPVKPIPFATPGSSYWVVTGSTTISAWDEEYRTTRDYWARATRAIANQHDIGHHGWRLGDIIEITG